MNKHARLAALALGVCVTLTACGGNDADEAAVDTAGGAVATGTPAVTGGAGTGSMEGAGMPRNDSEILSMISLSNDAEVSSSRLAQQQAQNAQVKAFAKQMVDDHTAMQKEGQQLAKTIGTEGTGTEASSDKKESNVDAVNELKDKKGADFDKAYMAMQVEAHEKTLNELRMMQQHAQNAELKSMIEKAIPKVEAHLQKAQQLRQTVDNAGSRS